MNKDTEKALLSGSFHDFKEAILRDDSAGTYELQELAKMAGLPDEMAYQVVSACCSVGKRQVVNEAKKQAENLIYWVERV